MLVDGEIDFFSLNSGYSQDVVCQIFKSALFRLCEEASDVVELCLLAFASVFQNESEESSFPLLEPFIPSCVANLLWESVMNSSEISNRQIVSIESAISRRPKVPSSARLSTRSGFIREKLVALGVIKVHPETRGLTLNCSSNLISSISSATQSIDIMRTSWNNCLVKGYTWMHWKSGTSLVGYHFICSELARIMKWQLSLKKKSLLSAVMKHSHPMSQPAGSYLTSR